MKITALAQCFLSPPCDTFTFSLPHSWNWGWTKRHALISKWLAPGKLLLVQSTPICLCAQSIDTACLCSDGCKTQTWVRIRETIDRQHEYTNTQSSCKATGAHVMSHLLIDQVLSRCLPTWQFNATVTRIIPRIVSSAAVKAPLALFHS